jgi:hypothetical protein
LNAIRQPAPAGFLEDRARRGGRTRGGQLHQKRRIGALKTNGSSQWTKFVQLGDKFLLDVPVQDQFVVLGASMLYTLASVPTGANVIAEFISLYTSDTLGSEMIVHSPLVANQAPNTPAITTTTSR